jgi:hypothetical protein
VNLGSKMIVDATVKPKGKRGIGEIGEWVSGRKF